MKECNGKMEFTYQFSEGDPKVTMTLSPGAGLGEVIESFEAFLIAAGYSFNGQLEINGNFQDSDLIDPNTEQN
jgi:hypothetical protein